MAHTIWRVIIVVGCLATSGLAPTQGDASPAVATKLPAPSAQAASSRELKSATMPTPVASSKEPDKWWEVYGAIANIIIAVCTVPLAAFAILQTLIARSNGRIQLRAYVFIQPTNVQGFKVGQKPEVAFDIHNSGSTPAYKLSFQGAVEILPMPLNRPPVEDFQFVDNGPKPSYVVRQSSKIDGFLAKLDALTQDEYDSVIKGTHTLYTLGHVDYTDVFQRVRRTEFCVFVGGNFAGALAASRAGNKPGTEFQWEFTRLYNEAT